MGPNTKFDETQSIPLNFTYDKNDVKLQASILTYKIPKYTICT